MPILLLLSSSLCGLLLPLQPWSFVEMASVVAISVLLLVILAAPMGLCFVGVALSKKRLLPLGGPKLYLDVAWLRCLSSSSLSLALLHNPSPKWLGAASCRRSHPPLCPLVCGSFAGVHFFRLFLGWFVLLDVVIIAGIPAVPKLVSSEGMDA